MKKILLLIVLVLGFSVQARAEYIGCFNASDVVPIGKPFADANGVAASPTSPTAKVYSPTDTTTPSFTPTLAEIDSSGSPGLTRGSFTLGSSPVTGRWAVKYTGTIGGNALTDADYFIVPCPKGAIFVGGIPAGASAADGILSGVSGTTLTLSTDLIAATDHHAYQSRIEVINPTTYVLKAVSCVVASTTAAGPADTVTTAEDISARIAVSDAFYLIPDPACRNLRSTTAGRTAAIDASGRVDLGSALGQAVTLDANNTLNVSAKYLGGTLQTARDIGASVLLSNGTGTGQLKLSAGYISPNWADVGSPTSTVALTNTTIGTATNLTNAPTAGDLTATMKTSVESAVWDAARASHTVAGSFGQGAQVVRAGTAQAGGANTITLDASASATNNIYNNELVYIISGTGAGQTNTISSYVGSTKVATLIANWAVNPDNTSVFMILQAGPLSATVAGNVTVGGYAAGQSPADLVLVTPANKISTNASNQVVASSVQGNVTGSVASVTGAVGSVTGNVGGNVVGSVASVTGNVGGNVTGSIGSLATQAKTDVENGVWEATASLHNTALTTGNKLNAAASAGDPWSTALPGAYGAGTAGNILGNRLDAAISSRQPSGNVTVGGYAAGQGPADLVLVTPANKISTNASNQVVASSVQGNVTGSVASVTGAVGSVTGNVGGNVVGSVASVTGNVGGNVVGSVASVTGNVGGNVTGSIGSLATQAKTDVENGVWDATASSHNTALTTGNKLNAAGSAGDPWATLIPGSYGAGTAGNILGNRLDAAVSSRLATTAFDAKIPTALTFTGGVPNVNTASLEGISLSGKTGDNFNLFFQNGGLDTTKIVDLVGTGGGGGGGTLDMTQAVPGSPNSGSVGQALRFLLDRLDLNVSTRASQASMDLKIPLNLAFTGTYLNAQVKGMDDGVITPEAEGRPRATIVTAAAGCNNGVNSGSVFSTNLTQTQANFWRSVQLLTMTSGALKDQSAQITGYTWTGSVGCITVSPALSLAPAIGDKLVIINK